jgi:SH3-like domain-containing protein
MYLRLAALAACLIVIAAPPALAQAILTQPLPPPPGTALAPRAARPPRPPASVLAAAEKPLAKTAAHGHVAAAAARPAKPKPAARGAAKVAGKPAAKPAAPPAAPQPTQAAAPPPPKIDPTKGTITGLPLPRWVSFRSDEVNLRNGPGMQYPIDWVYHRRDLPVRVLREFEVWRLVQEQDGTKGWVHQATLTGRRGFIVQNGEQVLRASASDTADPVARLEPGVVGHIRACAVGVAWCEVQVGQYRGWLKRDGMYGVSPDEAIE